MYKKHEYNIRSKCPVCGSLIFLDTLGNSNKCANCGWNHSITHSEFPDRVICPNLISLNKAIRLYNEGKPLLPDLDDFIAGFNFYGEMQFTYNNTIYGVVGVENVGVEFYGVDTDKYETYVDINEFKDKAQIDGKYLKEIWDKVTDVEWLQ